MSNIKNRKEDGFTIIEVLIVLAIAGLIMLIVFLAVPALQRNSRNTQRKNDVSAALSAVSEWSTNNGGKIPTSSADQTAAASNVKLGYYSTLAWGAGTVANPDNLDTVTVVTGAKCGTDGGAVGGSARQFAALYTVESGGGKTKLCQES